MASLYHTFPTLCGKEKSGKTKIWNAQVFSDRTAYCVIQFGQEDGKMQEARREYLTGKNIGKKNETTPLEQCMAETERKWKDKIEKEGYSIAGMSASSDDDGKQPPVDTIYPMLAQTYDPLTAVKKKKTIVYPCMVQPKIDGLRCLMYFSPSTQEVVCQSRTGGEFGTVGHIATVLHPLLARFPRWAIDGELYTRDYPFEELAGLIKKVKLKPEDHAKLLHVQYHVYDAISLDHPDATFQDRWTWVQKHLPAHPSVLAVLTEEVTDLTTFRQAFSSYVADGWEGIMLRNTDGTYTPNYRSHDLQKYKEFIEDEFPIVGWKEGEGRDEGTVIWQCLSPTNLVFSVRPRGTLEQRREWFAHAAQYVGQKLTVIFQEWSEKQVPRFPVGKAIRDGY